ncbi:hypothetical protein EVAR_80277_1 [Eumeta japonica]|uniref:Uncharacterized protein n=1 Tax=Eumeta variegata TaxID=151549 RepID=A0A4C1UBZ6_EUMVA|nr:hypothetical protein EVAR_80277_1 [Eumeta japonica]
MAPKVGDICRPKKMLLQFSFTGREQRTMILLFKFNELQLSLLPYDLYPTVKISCAFEPKAEGTGQLPLSQISSNSGDSEFVITSPSVEPHLINSEEFDDLVRDLNLPKLKAEILEAKIKAGIFIGPQIKKIMASEQFLRLLSTHEKQAWLSLKAVIHGFLGNRKAENYTELITDMLHNFKVMGCRMSLKVHMLHAHLDKFKDNLGAYSEEQGERFHQDVMNFEKRYQGQYNENMMANSNVSIRSQVTNVKNNFCVSFFVTWTCQR